VTAPQRARPNLAIGAGGERRGGDIARALRSTPCWFDPQGARETPRYSRETLCQGDELHGPAIIEDAWSTVVLPPAASLTVDAFGHLHIDVGAGP